MIITIDGPTASGKSSLAALLARTLHFYHLNTGMLYRALVYLLVSEKKYTEADLLNVKKIDIQECLNPQDLKYVYTPQKDVSIFYKENNIAPFLKDSMVDRHVAMISPQKDVREALVQVQRDLAAQYDLVGDGRDLGSHVFPHAEYKFYLTASLPVRAARWQKYQQNRGNVFSLEQAQKMVNDRDVSDQTREISPLVIPKEGIVVDNSQMNLQETVQEFLKHIQK